MIGWNEPEGHGGVFGSENFSYFQWVIFRFQPFIFRGGKLLHGKQEARSQDEHLPKNLQGSYNTLRGWALSFCR